MACNKAARLRDTHEKSQTDEAGLLGDTKVAGNGIATDESRRVDGRANIDRKGQKTDLSSNEALVKRAEGERGKGSTEMTSQEKKGKGNWLGHRIHWIYEFIMTFTFVVAGDKRRQDIDTYLHYILVT